MLTLPTGLIGLVDSLDDTDSDRLSHVTDSETTKRRVDVILLNTHRLAGDKLGNASIARLDELRIRLDDLTRSAVNLLDELGELAGDVSGMAIEDGSVTSADLTGVVEDHDLRVEGGSLLRGVVLGVGGDVTTANILDRDVPAVHGQTQADAQMINHSLDVETDVVTGEALLELLVVHLDGLHFSGDTNGSEGDNHASLDDTGLNTTDWHRADTTDLVDILKGKTEGLVGRTGRGLDGINGIEESLAFDDTRLGLLGPALVPWHAGEKGDERRITTKAYILTWQTPPTCCHRASQRSARMERTWGCNRPS